VCAVRCRSITWLGCCLLVLALHGAARAQQPEPPDAESRARTHYAAGKALYGLGNYSDALRELLVGYSLVPKPQFLLNIGQCYRRLDDPAKARAMYKKFLDTAPPDDPDRGQVEELIGQLDRQIAEREASAAKPAPPATTLVATPAEKPKRVRAWMWAVPVTVVAAAGLSIGLYFVLRPPSCAASYGCVSAAGGM